MSFGIQLARIQSLSRRASRQVALSIDASDSDPKSMAESPVWQQATMRHIAWHDWPDAMGDGWRVAGGD